MADNTDVIWAEVTTLGDLLVRAANLHPDRAAIVFPDRRATYAELLRCATNVARGLHAMGVQHGQHVGILMHNCLELTHAIFGIALVGAVAVPLHARHKGHELRYIIADAELVAVLTSTASSDYLDFGTVLHEAFPALATAATNDGASVTLADAPALRHVILMAGEPRRGMLSRERFESAADGVDPAVIALARRRVRVRDNALILYTSGTTAHPKGCMLSHEAITRGPSERARHRLRVDGLREPDGSTGAQVTWAAGPLYHIGSLGPFVGSVGVAGTFLADTFFDAGRALALMAREGVTLAWPWFSAIVQALLDHPSFAPESLRSLRHLFMIAPPPLVRRVIEALPFAEILQACGMTETAGVFALSAPDETVDARATTQGKVSPGIEVKVRGLREGSDEAALGEIGEILVRGWCVMSGYYRDPVKTAEALDAEGWLHTGDLYAKHDDGSLVFHGRLKDMLKVGGENVAAVEVEAFLCGHPAVRLAEVVGMPDARLDEVPVAFVELHAGASVTSQALIDFCRGKMASFKIPRAVHFMTPAEWPMSSTKVDKRALRERLGKSG